MQEFRVVPLSTSIADVVRTTGRAPRYRHPTHTEVATGYGPCRHCLRTFDEGVDRRVLFTWDAFTGRETLPLPGPVFIHEDACERYAVADRLPEGLLRIPVTLNAYAAGRRLVAQEHVRGVEADTAVRRLLARGDVAYIHVRNTEAGCFMYEVERAT